MVWAQVIGQTMREARRHAGLTQYALARLLGVSEDTVQRAERGHAIAADVAHAWWRVCGVVPRLTIEPAEPAEETACH